MRTIDVEIVPGKSGKLSVTFDERILASGSGAVVCEAARALVALGYCPATTWLRAYRGDLLCFSGILGNFARQRVSESEAQGPAFARWVPYLPESQTLPKLPPTEQQEMAS